MIRKNDKEKKIKMIKKIRKNAKFEPCNLNGYQDMDVTNLDQNPLVLSERGHLGISQGSIYVNI